jgi:hypothetical protein
MIDRSVILAAAVALAVAVLVFLIVRRQRNVSDKSAVGVGRNYHAPRELPQRRR